MNSIHFKTDRRNMLSVWLRIDFLFIYSCSNSFSPGDGDMTSFLKSVQLPSSMSRFCMPILNVAFQLFEWYLWPLDWLCVFYSCLSSLIESISFYLSPEAFMCAVMIIIIIIIKNDNKQPLKWEQSTGLVDTHYRIKTNILNVRVGKVRDYWPRDYCQPISGHLCWPELSLGYRSSTVEES